MTVMVQQDPKLAQRMAALRNANVIRTARAEIKADLKHGRAYIGDVLADPPPCLDSATIFDLLLATPMLGRVRANKVLKRAGVSGSRTVGSLPPGQRRAVVEALER